MLSDPTTDDGTPSQGSHTAVIDAHTVIVTIYRRADFDRLALPMTDHGPSGQQVLTKVARHPQHRGDVTVLFQHWYGLTGAGLTFRLLLQRLRLDAAATAA